MSALQTDVKLSNVDLLPRGVEWLTMREAVLRSGGSVRKWQIVAGQHRDKGDGLAREDEVGRLLIRSDADPALARIKFAQDIVPDAELVTGLTAAQREVWAWRCMIYQRYDAAKRGAVRAGIPTGEAVRRFIEGVKAEYPGKRLSWATLDRWEGDYRAGGRGGLISGHWTREKAPERDDPFGPELLRIFRLHNGLPVARVWRIARGLALDRGWAPWGKTKAAEYINNHTTPAERIYRRVGPDACRNTVEPHLTRDYSTIEPGDCYVGDHHLFDCIVQVGERIDSTTGEAVPILARPWWTGWLDMRTRKSVASVIRAADPDTDAILEGLRRACLAHGVPRTVYVDCGKDYSSKALHGET